MTKKKKKSNLKELKKKGEAEQKQTLPLLLIIILAGFILRLIYLIETENSPFITNLYSDSKIYFDWAKNISTSGNWLGDKIFFMSPGYPYFLAVIFSFFGNSITLIRIIQVIISSLNILVIFYIARYMFTRNTAFLAATISAIYSIFIFYSGAILSETLQTFSVSILLLLLIKPGDDNYKKWFLVGILLGVSALFRANILLFGIFLFPYIFLSKKICASIKSRMKLVLILYAGILLVILPVTLRNYVVGNDLVLLTSNGGINFYLGNNATATGIYQTPEGFDFFRDMAGESYAKKMTGKELSPSETSAYWYGKGTKFIVKEPLNALTLTIKKFFLFFDSSENPQSSIMNPDFFRTNYSDILKLPLPSFYFISILSILGFVLAWKERRNYSIINLLLLSYIASVVIFFIVGRFRVAITPVLIIYAGYAISKIYEVYKNKKFKELLVPVIITIIFLTAQYLISPNYNFSNYEAYTNLGHSYLEKGEYNQAIHNLRKSLDLKKTELAYVLLGNTYAARQNFDAALMAYRNALTINPDYALGYFNLGSFYIQQNNYNEGEKNMLRTIENDPAFAEAYRNLAVIYYINQDYPKSLSYFEKYLKYLSDPVVRNKVMQDIQEIKKRIDQSNNAQEWTD